MATCAGRVRVSLSTCSTTKPPFLSGFDFARDISKLTCHGRITHLGHNGRISHLGHNGRISHLAQNPGAVHSRLFSTLKTRSFEPPPRRGSAPVRECLGSKHLQRIENHAFSLQQWTIERRCFSSTVKSRQNEKNQEGKSKELNTKPKTTEALREKTSQIAQKLTQNLPHENIYTLPNFLTFSRLIATPVIGYLILHDQHAWAVALFGYAGFTDLVDGWIARRWNQQTVVGSVVDPMADKTLMTVLTICLTVHGTLPLWLATLILGRDVSLAIAAIYYRFASLPAPRTLRRYWDFSLPSAEVHPTGISKANTLLQLLLIGATTALPIAAPPVQGLLESWNAGLGVDDVMAAAQYTVAATTTWSGLSYLWTRGAVKILGEKSPEENKRILVKGRTVLGLSFASCLGVSLLLFA